jgi:DNA-binding response OmpR family regulator
VLETGAQPAGATLRSKMQRIVLGNLVLDRERFEVRVDGRRVELSYIQFELLHQLAARAGKVVDRDRMLASVWGSASEAGARRLRIQISRLRKKISESRPWGIRTVQKRGYVLADLEADATPGSERGPRSVGRKLALEAMGGGPT